MKKFTRILALVLVAVMALSLVGCGPASKINGKWEGEMEKSGISADITLEFNKKEKQVTTTVSVMGFEEDDTADYEFKGKLLIVDGEEVEYEFKGKNTLILDFDGEKVEFERVKD